MFEVEKLGSKKKRIVYAVRKHKGDCGWSEDEFLIYKKDDWEWVDADDYKPVKINYGNNKASKSDSKKCCVWEHDRNYQFIKSKCDFRMNTDRINIYNFKYCPNCGKKIKIKEI